MVAATFLDPEDRDELRPADVGVWRVRTVTDDYILDLDRCLAFTFRYPLAAPRHPLPGVEGACYRATRARADHLSQIHTCRLGEPLMVSVLREDGVWWLDPAKVTSIAAFTAGAR